MEFEIPLYQGTADFQVVICQHGPPSLLIDTSVFNAYDSVSHLSNLKIVRVHN